MFYHCLHNREIYNKQLMFDFHQFREFFFFVNQNVDLTVSAKFIYYISAFLQKSSDIRRLSILQNVH